jgi:hypothetical protein
MNHTKGPWAEHGKGGCPCGEIWDATGDCLVATVYGPSHLGLDGPDCVPGEQAQKDNARLIAGAPAMFDALREIANDRGFGAHNRMRSIASRALATLLSK